MLLPGSGVLNEEITLQKGSPLCRRAGLDPDTPNGGHLASTCTGFERNWVDQAMAVNVVEEVVVGAHLPVCQTLLKMKDMMAHAFAIFPFTIFWHVRAGVELFITEPAQAVPGKVAVQVALCNMLDPCINLLDTESHRALVELLELAWEPSRLSVRWPYRRADGSLDGQQPCASKWRGSRGRVARRRDLLVEDASRGPGRA